MAQRYRSVFPVLLIAGWLLSPAAAHAVVGTNPSSGNAGDYTGTPFWPGTPFDDQFTNSASLLGVPVLMGPGNDSFDNLTGGFAGAVTLGAGDDSFSGQPFSFASLVSGGDGNDSLTQSGFSRFLLGLTGDDTITVHGGGASLLAAGGAGDDVISIDPDGAVLLLGGGDGDDTITNLGMVGAARTGGGDDTWINGGMILGTVDLEDGDDTFILQSGGTIDALGAVLGGNGSDTLGFRDYGTVDAAIMEQLTGFENLGFFGGRTTLTGAWIFSGSTTVYEGTFTLAQGATLDTSGLTVNAGGTAHILGTLTAAGGWTDNAGTLTVDGLLVSSVSNTGLVGGSGTISGDLNNAGAVSPGNSIGTLTIGGSYYHGPGATYVAEISAEGQSDLLQVSGKADLNGGAVLTSLPRALYPNGFGWTLLTAAGGIDGSFATVQGQPASAVLSLALNYGASDVRLQVDRRPYASFGRSPGQRATGAGLDGLVSTAGSRNDEMTLLLTAMDFDFSADQIRQTLEALSPEMYAALSAAGTRTAQRFTRALSRRADRLRTARALAPAAPGRGKGPLTASRSTDGLVERKEPPEKRDGWVSWGRVLGSRTDLGGGDGGLGYDLESGGAVVGADGLVLPGLRLGIAVGAEQTDIDFSRGTRSGDQDAVLAGLYALAGREAFHVDASVSYGAYQSDADRTFSVTGTSRRAAADFDGETWLLRLGGGYDFRPGRWLVGPTAAVDYLRLEMDEFRETGAGFLNLDVDSRGEDRTLFSLGLRAVTRIDWSGGGLTPRIEAGWRHDFESAGHDLTATHRDYPSAPFSVTGAGQARDLLIVELGLTARFGRSLSAYLEGSGAWGSDTDAGTLSVGFEWRF